MQLNEATRLEPETELDWRNASMDRDLSWLEFNRRVLHEGLDQRNPLLERVKFLAIFTSNLDEFFMKRVGLLKRRTAGSMRATHALGAQNAEQHLQTLRQAVQPMLEEQSQCFTEVILPQLAEQGIHLLTWNQLTDDQRTEATEFFTKNVSPALTPLALDPGHPFPYLSNLSTNLGFVLRLPDSEQNLFARVKVPNILPHWIALSKESSDGVRTFLSLHEMIRNNADQLFAGMVIVGATLFRVVRNAEVEVDEDDAESLRTMVAEELRQRKFESVVRLELEDNPDPWVRGLLMRQFDLTEDDVYEMTGELDYTGLWPIASLDIPALRDDPWTPVIPTALAGDQADMFAVIRSNELLVHHPYESFDATVEHFIAHAAEDPAVVAIKMTVYRVGDDTPFVRSLIKAAESGKQVACLIELQARFDEERNLHWAKELEKIGAHVVYGVLGLKTHTKIALVVRKESDGLRCYAHIATGNYHVKTARVYTDLGLFTCDPVTTSDVINLFHNLTGRSRKPEFKRLLVAPINMRERFLAMVDREIEHHQAGRPARIIAKMNQLEDPAMCQALCQASCAGVSIDLIVRGFSCLRPGVEGLTENIRMRSVVGRFLEHSRIYYFANGQEDPLEGEFFIGSADWMQRNLSKRVEAIAPILARGLRERLWEILTVMLTDRRQAWVFDSTGTCEQLQPEEGDEGAALLGTHKWLMELTRRRQEDKVHIVQ